MAVDIIARAMAANASGGGKDVDYGSVTNKPQINGVTLEGNKTTSDLGINGIVELKGTEENPIELANIGEPGIYKISGYSKDLLTSSAADIGNDIILEVAKTNDAISQHYWTSNYAFMMMVRVTISGLPFTENFHVLSQNGDIENYNSINAYSLITSSTLSRYLGRGYMGKVLLTDLKTTDKKSLVNAINELVDTKQDKLTAGSGITIENNVISTSGSGGSAFPIIDATGETEIDLDNYLEEGTWIIKGNNIKQLKDLSTLNYVSPLSSYDANNIASCDSFMLVTKNLEQNYGMTQSQCLTFAKYKLGNPNTAIYKNFVGLRNTLPASKKEDKFTIWAVPSVLSANYRGYRVGFTEALSVMGANTLYEEIKNAIGTFGSSDVLARLSNLTTTDKTSLIAAINEINGKITSGTLATNLTEIQGYDATKTQVLKNINGQFTWVDES